MFSITKNIKELVATLALVIFTLMAGVLDGNAQTVRPAWCPSALYSGFAFQFLENQIYPGQAIQQSINYSYRVPSPSKYTATFQRGFTKSASVTVGIGTDVGVAAFASVKTNIDSSIARSVTVQEGRSQTFWIPANKRAMTYWGVDMRRTVIRTRYITPGCRVYRDYGNQVVFAPRNGTLKPQIRFVN